MGLASLSPSAFQDCRRSGGHRGRHSQMLGALGLFVRWSGWDDCAARVQPPSVDDRTAGLGIPKRADQTSSVVRHRDTPDIDRPVGWAGVASERRFTKVGARCAQVSRADRRRPLASALANWAAFLQPSACGASGDSRQQSCSCDNSLSHRRMVWPSRETPRTGVTRLRTVLGKASAWLLSPCAPRPPDRRGSRVPGDRMRCWRVSIR